MGEWIIETIVGDSTGTTIGIHSPIPCEAPGRRTEGFGSFGLGSGLLGFKLSGLGAPV